MPEKGGKTVTRNGIQRGDSHTPSSRRCFVGSVCDCKLICVEDNLPGSVSERFSSDDEQVLDDLDFGVFYLYRSFVTFVDNDSSTPKKLKGKKCSEITISRCFTL
jgi:hypothetical protein